MHMIRHYRSVRLLLLSRAVLSCGGAAPHTLLLHSGTRTSIPMHRLWLLIMWLLLLLPWLLPWLLLLLLLPWLPWLLPWLLLLLPWLLLWLLLHVSNG